LGNPWRLRLTTGRASDISQVIELVVGFAIERLITDRVFAAQAIYDWVVEQVMEQVIPSYQRAKGDVECFINKIKHFRRVFARFGKLASRYMSFLLFASSLI
jgi:hypothetical protein